MNKIKWGIIGCGDVTEIKSGPGFQKAPGSELIAVMRRTPDLARDYATRHNVPKWYSTTEALIADPDVDAVYIATPPGSHCEIARAVAQAKKPCYVEKPMARNTTECEIMLNAFTEAKQKLWVAYYRRAMPRFLKVKDLIDTQVIGKIVAIEFSFSSPTPQNADSTKHAWRVSAQHSGGGLLLDVGSHVLDILDFYFGALKEVKGISYRQNKLSLVEDYVEMTFFTAENIPGKASWNFYSEIKEDKLTLKGTKGEIYFAFGSDDPICVNTPLGLQSFNIPNPTHVAQPLIELITNELLGLGNAPSTGSSALRTQRVIDQVLTGFYGNRAVDFWNNTTTWPGLS
jgi:hypothetical protein